MNKIEEDINHGLTRMDADNKKLPEGWEWKKLSELFTIRPQKKQVKEKLDDGDEISFVPMECLNADDRNLTLKQVKTLKDVYSGYTYFENNDVLLAKITPCFENGKVGIARNLQNGIGFGSSEFIVFRSQGEVIPEYLYYYLSQESFRQEGKAMMAGAVGHKRVSKDFINDYKLPFPESIEEQKRIVAILDEAFDAIDKAKANAEKNLANAKELFESYLNGIFANPGEDWEEKNLGEVCSFVRGPFGGSLKKSFFKPAGFAVYEQQHAINDKFDNIRYFIDEKKFNEMKRFELKTGDLIMSCSGTMGKTAIVPDNVLKGIINQALLKLTPDKCLDVKFLKLWMESNDFQKQVAVFSQGAAIKNVASVKTLKEIQIKLPDLTIQNKVVNAVKSFSNKTMKLGLAYKQKIESLDELKKSILKKAFEGEL